VGKFNVFSLRGFVCVGELEAVLTPEHALALAYQLREASLAVMGRHAPDMLRVPVGASEYLSYLATNHKKGSPCP